MNQEQITSLAQKLKALAEKADGNEQVLAQQKLDDLLAKYNLAESDLEDTVDYHEFKYQNPGKNCLFVRSDIKYLTAQKHITQSRRDVS